MSVRELLAMKGGQAITIDREADLATAARLLMKHNIGALPVIDGTTRAPVGLIAERDIVRQVDRNEGGIRDFTVARAMRAPLPTCAPDDRLDDLRARMTRERLRHVVVVDGNLIVGVLSVGDLVKHRVDELQTETRVLRDYVAAQRASR